MDLFNQALTSINYFLLLENGKLHLIFDAFDDFNNPYKT